MDRAIKFTVTSWYLDRGLPPGETGRSKSNSSSPMNDTPTAANKVKQIFNTFITEGNTFYMYYIYIVFNISSGSHKTVGFTLDYFKKCVGSCMCVGIA